MIMNLVVISYALIAKMLIHKFSIHFILLYPLCNLNVI